MNTKSKIVVALVTVFVMSLFLGGCSFGKTNIGVLDVNKVMTDSPQVKAYQDQLNTKGKELSDQLEKDKASLSQEDFQTHQKAAYDEFMKVKQDLEGQIDSAIKQALEQVAKEKNLGVVVYKNSVAQGGTDITDDVIKKMQ